ncbi:MAG: helix-turn-helix domain-containing protein, partial [Pirellulaceae bacterium]
MQYVFRLAELLGHTPDRHKRPGTIKAIVEYTGLDRHQVAALLKNEAKYIPLEALSRLCDYLIEHGYASAEELPGALFAIKPENFWELLARRKRLEICVGVRRPPESDTAESAWVVASDAVLVGEVLNGVSTLGGT